LKKLWYVIKIERFEVKKMKIIGFFIGVLILLLLANTCSAGLSLSVIPEDGTYDVTPGETISYIATVIDNETSEAENVYFSINRTYQTATWNPNWDYVFDPSTVRLADANDFKSSKLTLQIPANATPATYYHTVQASATTDFEEEIKITGRATVHVVPSDVTNVPEFPSIALPVAAVLGLVFVFGHKKE
jgi:uncharacterized membrane protein